MNKIKKIWRENKVLLVLAVILIICLVVTGIVTLTYFYGASDNVYGNRLDITKKVPLDKKLLEDIKETLEKNEIVEKADAKLKGKIVYINVTFKDDTKMDDAKKGAEDTISLFNEDELGVYDIQYTITTSSKTFTLMGAHNSNGSGQVVWNNYKEESSEQ